MINIIWSDYSDDFDWQALSQLYDDAGMSAKAPDALRTAFANSLHCCFLHLDGQLIGAGRALGDGVFVGYLSDIAIAPALQGQGLGKAIVSYLLQKLEGHQKILLYANPGKEDFYRQFGFRRMCTAMAIFDNEQRAAERGFIEVSG